MTADTEALVDAPEDEGEPAPAGGAEQLTDQLSRIARVYLMDWSVDRGVCPIGDP